MNQAINQQSTNDQEQELQSDFQVESDIEDMIKEVDPLTIPVLDIANSRKNVNSVANTMQQTQSNIDQIEGAHCPGTEKKEKNRHMTWVAIYGNDGEDPGFEVRPS